MQAPYSDQWAPFSYVFWHSATADLNPKSNLNWKLELKIYCIKGIPFLAVRKILGRILLSTILHFIFCKMKTISCNAHYKVVALTLRHLSQLESSALEFGTWVFGTWVKDLKMKTCLPASVSNVRSRQNSQTAHKSKPIFLSVSSLPET